MHFRDIFFTENDKNREILRLYKKVLTLIKVRTFLYKEINPFHMSRT